MNKEMKKEEIKEEPKIETTKFTRPDVTEELTRENIEDIIEGQKNSIIEQKKEIERKEDCIKHYQSFL